MITDTSSLPVINQDLATMSGCDTKVELVPESYIGKHGLGFGFRKNYTFGKIISDTLLDLQDAVDGESYLKKKWFLDYCHDYTPVEQFHWTYFSGLLVIVGFTVAIGLCINVMEYFFVERKLNGDRNDSRVGVNRSNTD